MIPIWHKEDGKWYLIPNQVRNRLNEGDKLSYDPDTKCWTTYGPGFRERITGDDPWFIRDEWEPE